MLCGVLCAPLFAVGALCFMAAPMMTDSCTPHGCQALNRVILLAPCLLLLALLALAGCWRLPSRRRLLRPVLAVGALTLAPAAVHLYVDLPAAN